MEMMKHAYDDQYVDSAMDQVSELFEIATVIDHQNIDFFVENYFLPYAAPKIESCDPFFILGKSSLENYAAITGKTIRINSLDCLSNEYWAGWVLAFTQWYFNRPFSDLISVIPASSLVKMYDPLHEASETQTARVFEEAILARDLAVSDRIEIDSIKASELYKNKENDYSILFLLASIQKTKQSLSKGYIEDSKEFPWNEIDRLVDSAFEKDISHDKLKALMAVLPSKIEFLESLRDKYINRMIKARYGDFRPFLLKEYDEKERKRQAPKLLKRLKDSKETSDFTIIR